MPKDWLAESEQTEVITPRAGKDWLSEDINEGFLKKLPRNIGIGGANLARDILNQPSSIAQGFKEEGKATDEALRQSGLEKFVMPKPNFNLADYVPRVPEYDFAKIFGQQGEPTTSDYLIQKGTQYAPELAIGGNVLKKLLSHAKVPGFFSSSKSVKNQLLNSHDRLLQGAEEAFDYVMDEVYKRGIGKVSTKTTRDKVKDLGGYTETAGTNTPLNPLSIGTESVPQIEGGVKKLPNQSQSLTKFEEVEPEFIPGGKPNVKTNADKKGKVYEVFEKELKGHFTPKFFDNLKKYFPQTDAAKSLLNKARDGDFKSLRGIQSDLYKRGVKNLSSPMEYERLRGMEMLEQRDKINQAISDYLKRTGNHDLDEVLNKARDDYRILMQTYYNKDLPNSLKKMFNKDVRRIPKNINKLLEEESIPMRNLMDRHPGLSDKIKGQQTRKNALKFIKEAGKLGVGTAAIGGTYNYLTKD